MQRGVTSFTTCFHCPGGKPLPSHYCSPIIDFDSCCQAARTPNGQVRIMAMAMCMGEDGVWDIDWRLKLAYESATPYSIPQYWSLKYVLTWTNYQHKLFLHYRQGHRSTQNPILPQPMLQMVHLQCRLGYA